MAGGFGPAGNGPSGAASVDSNDAAPVALPTQALQGIVTLTGRLQGIVTLPTGQLQGIITLPAGRLA